MGFISYLEQHMLACQWKQHFGVECMGCGMQRSVILLLKGQFVDAFYMYPAIYTLIAMFSFLLLHINFNFKKGAKVLLYLFIINVIIMITNYIIKIY